MNNAGPYRLSDLIASLEEEHCQRANARKTGEAAGPVTGIERLDVVLGGWLAPGLHIVQGAPGCGKTAFALQVVAHCGCGAVYVSAEMPLNEVFRRMITQHAFKRLDFVAGLDGGQVRALATTTAEALPLVVVGDGSLDEQQLRQCAAELREESGRPPLVIIDSVQIWAQLRSSSRYSGEYETTSAAITTLSELALALDCPVFGISHRNRAGQQSGGLFASKGTGGIEYLAESLLEMTPDLGTDASGQNIVSIAVLKNRHGAIGEAVRLRFNGPLQSFSPLR